MKTGIQSARAAKAAFADSAVYHDGKMIKDVVFFTNVSYANASEELRTAYPPVTARIPIYHDVYAEKPSRELWRETREACTLIGHQDATPQFRELYAFARDLEDELDNENRIIWDRDERLQVCLGLSRLIHPTNVSFEYSARFFVEDGNSRRVVPGPVMGFGGKAWISRADGRNWLSIDEIIELASVARAFYTPGSQLPTRIKQALWYLEYAFRTELLDVRWPLVCIGLESLIHTEFGHSTAQFSRRVSMLADETGISDFTVEKTKEVYETRSALAHGKLFRDLDAYNLDIYEKAEDTLRLVIKKAILEPSYGQRFASIQSVRDAYSIR